MEETTGKETFRKAQAFYGSSGGWVLYNNSPFVISGTLLVYINPFQSCSSARAY